ncbi:MAG: methylenetetrahydrofolate reductase [NAD(P)H] [Eubacterium sp.]|nr:methylenetetrahydrofolate reductase [NAD(P)H] [Eubacterium sp.]
MKVCKVLKEDKLTISFEVFPPKTSDRFDSVLEATKKIASYNPDFMSVTYGAGGGTSEFTAEIASSLQKEYEVPIIAHLTCVSSTKDFVSKTVESYKKNGIKNIMALRGDIPKEGRIAHDYNYASELIRELKAQGEFCIGGACYPEGHVECENKADDIKYLKEKVEAGCDFLTTQMFFDNNIFYNFLYRARESGITVPIVPGIMPITTKQQLKRSVAMSGTNVPERFRAIVDKFGNSPEKMQQVGILYAADQIVDLIANGINHIHVYSMNKPDVAKGILNHLSEVLGRDIIE